MTLRISSLAIGEFLLRPPTSCGQRRSQHLPCKSDTHVFPYTFRYSKLRRLELLRTGRASVGVAIGRCAFSRPWSFSSSFLNTHSYYFCGLFFASMKMGSNFLFSYINGRDVIGILPSAKNFIVICAKIS